MFTSASKVAGNIYETMSNVDRFFGLTGENKSLIEQNTQLMNEIQKLKNELATYKDSASLEEYLSLHGKKENFTYKSARVINSSYNKVNNYITLDKGSRDGMKPEMGVFNKDGVVGIIYQTSDNYSLVIPLLNSKSNINCRVRSTNSYSALHWEGGDARYSYLVDLPRYGVFEKGDTIVTSGFSSIFPADIPVGTLEELEDTDDGLFYRAKVKLFVDFTSIDNVFIISNDSKEEESTLEKKTIR
jgi:rod shape-determining protein MreC